MDKKKIYKELNLPNPTIRERFIPKFNIRTLNSLQKKTIRFDAPGFLKDDIEYQVTGGQGYQNPHEKNRENISKKELLEYLKEKEEKVLKKEQDLRSNQIYNLFTRAEENEKILYEQRMEWKHLTQKVEKIWGDIRKITENGIETEKGYNLNLFLKGASEKDIETKDVLVQEDGYQLLKKGCAEKIAEERDNYKNKVGSQEEHYENKLAQKDKEIKNLKNKLGKNNKKGLLSRLFG
jgi:exonuclease VII large subunit